MKLQGLQKPLTVIVCVSVQIYSLQHFGLCMFVMEAANGSINNHDLSIMWLGTRQSKAMKCCCTSVNIQTVIQLVVPLFKR